MPGHISKTVLSAGGCHSALEAHANICQATTQRMKAMPSCPLPRPHLSLSFSLPLSEYMHLKLSIIYPCTNASLTIMTSHCTIWQHLQCDTPCRSLCRFAFCLSFMQVYSVCKVDTGTICYCLYSIQW